MVRDNRKHTKVVVSRLPKCQFCNRKAEYDGKTVLGPWGYMCAFHFGMYGVGLGLGRGQKLTTKTPRPKAKYRTVKTVHRGGKITTQRVKL